MTDVREWSDVAEELGELKEQYVSGELSDVEFFLRVDELGSEDFLGIISWPRAFASARRGIERESCYQRKVSPQRLGVYTTTVDTPCAFCNADDHVSERGVVEATRKLLATEGPHQGAVVGYSCRACLVGCYVEKQ